MSGIIIFLILAVGYALCGDTSGIEAIGKGILYIAVFIGVGCIIVCVPWLILVIIIGIIIWIIISSKENSTHATNNNSINYHQQYEEIKTSTIDYSNQSDFQLQLQESTKTPQQVEDENWLKEKEQITNEANKDYKYIKEQLINKAKSGQYSAVNEYKCISIDYYCSYLMDCVHREHYYNPTGRIGTSSYRTNQKVSYSINKEKQCNLYLSTIKELGLADNIRITPFWVEIDPVVYQKENRINLPYTYKHEWRTTSHKIKAYLKCSVKY